VFASLVNLYDKNAHKMSKRLQDKKISLCLKVIRLLTVETKRMFKYGHAQSPIGSVICVCVYIYIYI
jgi:hypothetical protein